jgi:hypothetical protein
MSIVDKFDKLRDERRKASTALIEIYYYKTNPNLISEITYNPLVSPNGILYDPLTLNGLLEGYKATLANLNQNASTNRDQIPVVEQYIKHVQDLIRYYQYFRDRYDAAKRQYDTADAQQGKAFNYLVNTDETISGLLVQTRNSDDFRKIVTIIFALLMGFVIIGFFVITVFNRKLLESIFSSDAGLQFITLFAIIIAIILFGVTNILEGRELSALLGAISGYILGRSTLAAVSQTGRAGVASQAGAGGLASQPRPADATSQPSVS